jgi:hypothetical protein
MAWCLVKHNFIYLKIKELGQLSGTALGYWLDDPGFDSRQGLEFFSPPRSDLRWAHPTSYIRGIGDSFSAEKTAGA